MKAIPLGDKIRLVAENESDNAVIKLVTKTHRIVIKVHGSEIKNGEKTETLTIGAGEEPLTAEQRAEKYVDSLERDLGITFSGAQRRVLIWANS